MGVPSQSAAIKAPSDTENVPLYQNANKTQGSSNIQDYQASKTPGAYSDFNRAPPLVTLGYIEYKELCDRKPYLHNIQSPPFESFKKQGKDKMCSIYGCNNFSYFHCTGSEMSMDHIFERCEKQFCPSHIKVNFSVIKHKHGFRWKPTRVTCVDPVCAQNYNRWVVRVLNVSCKYAAWMFCMVVATIGVFLYTIINI